jgi:hypothetical protein
MEVVHGPGKMLGSLQLALHERLVDNHLRSDVREFTTLPRLHLFLHGFKVPLHPIHTDRNAVDK